MNDIANLIAELREGPCVHAARWCGDGGRIDEAATNDLMRRAADELERLWLLSPSRNKETGGPLDALCVPMVGQWPPMQLETLVEDGGLLRRLTRG